jgi:hypothetical protein
VYFGDCLNTKALSNLGEKMTENMENTEDITPQEETPGDAPQKVETLFFVSKDLDGTFRVITDVSTKLEIQRKANLLDIRTAAKDIASAISTRETAEMVVALLKQANKQSEE